MCLTDTTTEAKRKIWLLQLPLCVCVSHTPDAKTPVLSSFQNSILFQIYVCVCVVVRMWLHTLGQDSTHFPPNVFVSNFQQLYAKIIKKVMIGQNKKCNLVFYCDCKKKKGHCYTYGPVHLWNTTMNTSQHCDYVSVDETKMSHCYIKLLIIMLQWFYCFVIWCGSILFILRSLNGVISKLTILCNYIRAILR